MKQANNHILPLTCHSWQGLDNFNEYFFDPHGIPVARSKCKNKLHDNPVIIVQYGLSPLENYARYRQEKKLRKAVQIAEWLIADVEKSSKLAAIWIYYFRLSSYGPKAHWISAMAKEEAVSFFLRLYQILSCEQFLEVARPAIKPFYVIVSNGGVFSELQDGSPFFEEFPSNPPSRILNGHIFALIGLCDDTKFFDDDRARLLWDHATTQLVVNLYRWDTAYGSLYDLPKIRQLASYKFQTLHVRLLNVLYELTQKTIYCNDAQRWLMFERNFACKSLWLVHKIFEKIRLSDCK